MRAGLVIVGILLAAGLAGAQEEGPQRLTLEDCIRIGLERSSVVLNARRDEAIANTQIRQARSAALPTASLTAGYTRLDELQEISLGDEGESTEFGTLDNYSVGARIDQVLYSSRIRAAMRAAGQARLRSEHVRTTSELKLVRDIRTGFSDILLAKAAIEVHERSIEQLELLVKQTRERFTSGTTSEFDLISAQVKLQNARPRLIEARNAHAVALSGFGNLLNMDAPFELEGRLGFVPSDYTLRALRNRALMNRTELKEMESLVRLREEDVIASSAGVKPKLGAYALYNGANAYQFVSFEDEWEWHWNVGVALEWSLWDGGLTHNRVKEKRLELEKAKTRQGDLKRLVELEVTQAYLDLTHARQALEAAEGGVTLAGRAVEIAQTRHKTGLGTYLEFVDATVAQATSRLIHLTALRNYLNAIARLEYAAGIDHRR